MKNLTGTGWILLVVPSRLNSSTFSYQNACLGHRSHTVWQNISLPSTLRAIMKNVSTCN
uniref:Uncharacterized protein n=1 Tax=Anguilla anguilla TaxID=7936 RepID=A0A0E9V2P7_ANGAN